MCGVSDVSGSVRGAKTDIRIDRGAGLGKPAGSIFCVAMNKKRNAKITAFVLGFPVWMLIIFGWWLWIGIKEMWDDIRTDLGLFDKLG